MLKIRRRKHKINIISLSLVITLLSSFFTYNNVLAKEIDNNKKDISCSKKDSMWSKAKKYLLTGVAVTGAGFVLKSLSNMNKEKNDGYTDEIDFDIPNVHVLGHVEKESIFEALGFENRDFDFKGQGMRIFKMEGQRDGIAKAVNMFFMTSDRKLDFISKFSIESTPGLNIVAVDLDANIDEIKREIDNWKNIIHEYAKDKRTIFVCTCSGENIDEDKANRIKAIVNLNKFALEWEVLTPSVFLISRDKNCEEGKNLKDNILRLT